MTKSRGIWSGSPVVNQPTAVSGNTVNCDGAPSSVIVDYAKIGDPVQFSNDKKVYWLTADADTDASGNFTLKLDSPLVVDSVDGSTIKFGTDVEFRWILSSPPTETYTQLDSTQDKVAWGRIQARETIE